MGLHHCTLQHKGQQGLLWLGCSDNGIAGMVSRKDIWTQFDTCPRAQLEGCKPKQQDASRHRSRLARGVAGGETSQHWQWCPESAYMSEGACTHIC